MLLADGRIATQLLNEITTIQGFIAAQTLVTNVTELQENQCTSIAQRILAMDVFSIDAATALTHAINGGPWSESQKARLASSIQTRVAGKPLAAEAGTRTRRKNQSCFHFERYLTVDDTQVLQSPSNSGSACV